MRKLLTYCRKAFRFLRSYSAPAAAAVVGSPAATGVGLLTPWPIKILIDSVLSNDPLPRLLTGLIGGAPNRGTLLVAVVAGGFALAVLTSAVTVITGYITTKLDLAMTLDFRSDLFRQLLFSASIADDIRYSRLDATMDEIVEAARAANAHDFVSALPQRSRADLAPVGAAR